MVSDDFFGKEVRAIGGVQSCPDDEKNWNVWDGEDFTAPDLHEPWSPYIEADHMFECRPENFEVSSYSSVPGQLYQQILNRAFSKTRNH